ncbi:MAG: 50S ribosomal protein L4 [Candidatus Brocadiaceae bacterium]|nr:50S ribosomal protein L4 [Candidatus Brocadiaceae bacterium]
MDIPVYNIAGQVVDHVSVDAAALGGKPNMALLRQALLMYEANKRVGTASVKTRSTVSGSGKKPWRQKHTGRARHGSRYSPIWVGGAVAHGPQPRDYRQRMPRNARRRALASAFLAKAIDGEVLAVDALELPEARTKAMASVLKNVGATRTCLIVLAEHDGDLWRCTRNIPGAAMCTCRELNAYDMVRPQRVVFTREALEQFLNSQADRAAEAAAAAASEQAGV